MSNAQSGHGATLAVEQDPDGAQGTFLAVAELASDLQWPSISRAETEVTPHNDVQDSYVFGVLRRGAVTFTVNWIPGSVTHGNAAGFLEAIKLNQRRGFQFLGPGASAGAVDEWIASGEVQNVDRVDPVREGVRSAEITIRFSGPMIIDNAAYTPS